MTKKMFLFASKFRNMLSQRLIYSESAKLANIDNVPTSLGIMKNLQQLQDFLVSLERILGVEIIVNSGYRCPELNRIVGGSPSSYHMLGLAADIKVEDSARCTLTDLKNLCKELRKTRLAEVIVHDTYVHIAIKLFSNL